MRRILAVVILILMLTETQLFAADKRSEVKVPVILYHVVDESGGDLAVTPSLFREHMVAIYENGYTPVSIQEMIGYVEKGWELPQNPVCITFDDGYTDNYENAYPILKEYNAKATIFVIGVSVGKEYYKDTNYKMTPHFSYEQAREMVDSGLVSIQSHTYDMHQWAPFEPLSNPRENVLRQEGESLYQYVTVLDNDIKKSGAEIKNALGVDVVAFAYPTGKYNGTAELVLRKNGIKVTMTTIGAPNYIKKHNPYSLYGLNRYGIDGSVTSKQLIEWLKEE